VGSSTSKTRAGLRAPVRRAAQVAYASMARRPLQPRTVLLESFAGTAMTCNPYALFTEMRSDPRFQDHRFVWAVQADLYNGKTADCAGDPRVTLVKYRSVRYFQVLATAQILINNVTFPAIFAKRPGQFYLNTWHGTPLKRMGVDARDGAAIQNTVANFKAADVLLSTSKYMGEVMYGGAYDIGSAGNQIREVGYPRIDAQFQSHMRVATRAALANEGLAIAGKRVILYAPTWRSVAESAARAEVREVASVVQQLRAGTDPQREVVIARLHDSVTEYAKQEAALRGCLVSDRVRTNELLGVTDTLITDYSSIFFDHLATGSEILFYTPDADNYDAGRGLYLSASDLPGPRTAQIAQLLGWLSDRPRAGFVAPEDARRIYAPHEDGRASQRVLDLLPSFRRQ
jgi:CDP-glycerol glycerophosphotransferase